MLVSWELSRFEDGLRVNGNFNQIADDKSAAVQSRVPAYAEVVAVDRGRGNEACTRFGAAIDAVLPPGRLPFTQIANAQFAGAGHAANGQIPAD